MHVAGRGPAGGCAGRADAQSGARRTRGTDRVDTQGGAGPPGRVDGGSVWGEEDGRHPGRAGWADGDRLNLELVADSQYHTE
jgi:hypothetical protein